MEKLLCYPDGREYRGRYQQVLSKKSKKLMPFGGFNLHYSVCQVNSKSVCLHYLEKMGFFCVYLSKMKKMATLQQ